MREEGPASDATQTEVPGELTVPIAPVADEAKPVVAGYDMVRVLGRGGMGVVWEAIEHRFDRRVAVKVHAEGRALLPDELWSEALIAARIGDPGIVRVLDVGLTLAERPYYAMELVDGTDLATLLADGPLAPRKAVDVAADVARAAAAAHEYGVIHRDLKPRNVIVDPTGRARVLDFGIALDTRASDVDPYAGQLAGSPAYMAPEQALGHPVVPQTDIFAIGVMLYEMLTGARPFEGSSREALLFNIAAGDVRPPSAMNASIHRDLDAVVGRCLAKSAEDRFPTARALFETLCAIAEGRPIDTAPQSLRRPYIPKVSTVPPPDRPRRDEAKKHLSWSWRLASSPGALWPHVANTDRFNKAVGLAPIVFTDEPAPEGGAIRTGEMRVLGMAIRWREFPFEWVKDREHSVFRWYRSGPLAALWNRVKLTPIEGGGTELEHDIWLTPRGVVGQVAAFVEIDRKLGPAVDRFYRHLDDVLVAGGHVDPFEPAHAPTPDQGATVEAACARLRAEGFAPAIVERLAMHLLTAPDGVLGALRPHALADAWRADRSEVLDVLMHAAHAGALEPAWDVVCPRCMLAHESLQGLAQITRVGTCSACATSFERDLRDSVELVFVPSPSVRSVPRTTYCAGAPALRPHVVAQQVVEPGGERRLTMDLTRGEYRVTGALASAAGELVASAVGFESEATAVARDGRIHVRPSIVRAGTVTLVLRNEGDDEETLRLELAGARGDGVAAATAMTHPAFRELFADQLLAHGEHLRVSHLAFVFVELIGRQGVFEKLGDASACAELTRLDELVRARARAHEGTAVPSSLDILIVAFPTVQRALRAALELRMGVDEARLSAPVAIAAHDGRCIALTREGKPEFFGETLLRGQALLRDCPTGGIALSATLAADRAVAVAVHESGMRVGVVKSDAGPYAGRRVTVLAPA
ncbi:MAG: serine/threonine protein kinase [Labilithrix sp.]|nr:serine/threonine protein kinase [Labilithrix sp.]